MSGRLHVTVVLVFLLLVFQACGVAGRGAEALSDADILHLLNRMTYGARPGDVERVRRMGVERYIRWQLAPESIPESQAMEQKLGQLETIGLSSREAFIRYGKPLIEARREAKRSNASSKDNVKRLRKQQKQVLEEARLARLMRAVESERQLQEVMTDFWFNHFNVYAGKGLLGIWTGTYEREAIRPHALGRFRDLLGATARHPAMMMYLDNWLNTAPGSKRARGRFKGLNENYARELLELHTLGVDGGYSQQDVQQLARVLTGWGLPTALRSGRPGRGYNPAYPHFDPLRHDYGDKKLLGRTIRGSGPREVEQVLDQLARHPSTARHISTKLARHFVADDPPVSLVNRLTARFQQADGDIREVLYTLFQSPEFRSAKYRGSKFKTPYQYVVSLFRATGEPPASYQKLPRILHVMGMPLYGKQTPDGYKDTQDAWLSPDAMMKRLSFAMAVGRGRFHRHDGVRRGREVIPSSRVINVIEPVLSARTRQAVRQAFPRMRTALVLGSPELMMR